MPGSQAFKHLFWFLCAQFIFLPVALAQTAKDLEGDWIVEGYQCDTATGEQRVRVAASGDRLTAIKITGDNCVPAGEITWTGKIEEGGTIFARANLAEPHTRDYNLAPAYFTIVNEAEIAGGDLFTVMHKVEACKTPDADGILAANDFSAGREGWQVSGDVASRHGALPDFLPSGGNDGGHLGAEDEAVGGVWYFDAPRAYRGNLSCAYGGDISFDLKQPHLDSQFGSPDVEISGRGGVLTYTFPEPPGTDWTGREVPLSVEAAWYADGALATREDMKNILSSVRSFRIRGEYISGNDYGEMDNVMLRSGGDDPVEFGEEPVDPVDKEKAEIYGRVIYARNDAPVDLATVILTNTDTGAFIAGEPVKKETDARFSFTSLEPGNYTVAVSDASGDYEAFSTSEEVEDLEAGDQARVWLVLEPARINVSGKVYAIDAKNTPQPIRNAEVIVEFSDGEEIETYSNDSGAFWANYDEVPPDAYTVYVRLQDRDEIINVRSVAAFQDEIVDLKTKEIDIIKPHMRTNIFFSPTFKLADPSYSRRQKQIMRDAGAFYVNAMKAVDFTRNDLGLELDFNLPVETHLYALFPGPSTARYFGIQTKIEIARRSGSSLATSTSSPTNREFHEFGHHVNGDSELMGEDLLPTLAAGDFNHAGVSNSTSLDSMKEGFAEFFALMINDDPVYRTGGRVANLQHNFHTLWNGNPEEEFNLAALLWDLSDSDDESGDYFALGHKATWDILNDDDISTIWDFYEILKDDYELQDTNLEDGLSDLDALFILHRFYSDTNMNGAYDDDEPIGYPDYHRPRPATSDVPRENVPREPGTLLAYTMVELETETPLSVPYFAVTVFYEDGRDPFSYTQFPEVEEEEDARHVAIFVPYGASQVEVKPMIPGYDVDPYYVTPAEFVAQVGAAKEQELDVYASYDFVAYPNNIPAPEDALAVMDAGIVRVSWATDYEVIVVRGLENYPLTPDNGVVVFEGVEREISDTGALFLEGATAYYSIFAGDSRGWVSAPVFATVEISEPEIAPAKDNYWIWLIGLVLGGGLVLFILVGRRRKEKKPA